MTNDLFDLRYLDNINNNQNTVNPSLMQGFEFTQSQNKFKEGFGIVIPPNTYHWIKNTSKTKTLKLYSIALYIFL